MDKIKSFVIKYQLWFKLAACILLVCMIFTPLLSVPFYNQQLNKSIETFVHNFHDFFISDPKSHALQYIFALISLILIICIIITVFLSIFIKYQQFYLIFSLSYIVCYVFIILTFISAGSYGHNESGFKGIPHIAFFLALLLLVADIICIVFWIKSHKPSPSKDERIAELEKRIEELESKTADKNKSPNIEKSNEKDGE